MVCRALLGVRYLLMPQPLPKNVVLSHGSTRIVTAQLWVGIVDPLVARVTFPSITLIS